jgi:Zn-dependent alcohol dehydrogenase
MRIRAAVPEEFGAPIVVQDVELEEPRHTDLYIRSVIAFP